MNKGKLDKFGSVVSLHGKRTKDIENFIKKGDDLDKMSPKEKKIFFKHLHEMDKELEKMERELDKWDQEYIKESCFDEDQILPLFIKGLKEHS